MVVPSLEWRKWNNKSTQGNRYVWKLVERGSGAGWERVHGFSGRVWKEIESKVKR